jgi:hypothetical protein
MKHSTEKHDAMRKSAKPRRERATMSERESSDAPPRKRSTKKDEPENHTRHRRQERPRDLLTGMTFNSNHSTRGTRSTRGFRWL